MGKILQFLIIIFGYSGLIEIQGDTFVRKLALTRFWNSAKTSSTPALSVGLCASLCSEAPYCDYFKFVINDGTCEMIQPAKNNVVMWFYDNYAMFPRGNYDWMYLPSSIIQPVPIGATLLILIGKDPGSEMMTAGSWFRFNICSIDGKCCSSNKIDYVDTSKIGGFFSIAFGSECAGLMIGKFEGEGSKQYVELEHEGTDDIVINRISIYLTSNYFNLSCSRKNGTELTIRALNEKKKMNCWAILKNV